MKKLSPNAPCPCNSKKKYKKCCQAYHKGAKPKTALLLMRSRYVAYALAKSDYIIKTTHPNNPDYTHDVKKWKQSIELFSQTTEFLGLEILEFVESEEEAFVSFKARLSSEEMIEKSRFLKERGIWLYESGVFL